MHGQATKPPLQFVQVVRARFGQAFRESDEGCLYRHMASCMPFPYLHGSISPCLNFLPAGASLPQDTSLLLIQGKHPPSAQSVKQLLDATRPKRVQWLKELVSIREIFVKYPCLKTPKWVSEVPRTECHSVH